MVTGEVRFSYANVFDPAETPSGDMKYSVSVLILKEDKKTIADMNKAIQAAVAKGLEKAVFTKAHVKSLRLPIRDGDEEIKEGKRGKEYAGFFFVNPSSKNQPGIVNTALEPLMKTEDFYSGCWGRADVNFFPYNTKGNRGIGVGLNNLMKTKDDARLDGRQSAEQAFGDYASVPDEAEGSDADLT